MFYSVELLSLRKRGKFAKCWFAGTINEQAFKKKFPRAIINSIKISVTCQEFWEVIQNRSHVRFSLHLSMQLLYGIVRVYYYQIQYLKAELFEMEKILAEPKKKKTRSINLDDNGNMFQLEAPPPLNELLPSIMPNDLHLLPEDSNLDAHMRRMMQADDLLHFGAMTDKEMELFLFGGAKTMLFNSEYPLSELPEDTVRHLPEPGQTSPNNEKSDNTRSSNPLITITTPVRIGSPLMRRSRNEVLGSPYSSQRSHIIDMTVLRSPCSTPGKRIPTEVRIDSPSKRRKLFADVITEDTYQIDQPDVMMIGNNQVEPGIEPLTQDVESKDPTNSSTNSFQFLDIIDLPVVSKKRKPSKLIIDEVTQISGSVVQVEDKNVYFMTRKVKKNFGKNSFDYRNLLRLPSTLITTQKLRPINCQLQNIFYDRFNNICETIQGENFTIGDSEHQIHETELVAVPRTNLNIEQDELIDLRRGIEETPHDFSESNNPILSIQSQNTLIEAGTSINTTAIQETSVPRSPGEKPIDDTKDSIQQHTISLPLIDADPAEESFLPYRSENIEILGSDSGSQSLFSRCSIINKQDLHAVLEVSWSENNRVKFSNLVPTICSKFEAASSLMCLLQLATEGKVILEQFEACSEIFIAKG